MTALRATRGDTLTASFTLDRDTTGWSPRWTLKAAGWESDSSDADALVSAAVGSGLVNTPGTGSSVVSLTLTAAQTALLPTGVHTWDLQLSAAGEVRTVEWAGCATGTLTVSADVTRTAP